MVLSNNYPLKETMPQTVPSAGYTPPFDYTVFAADCFDLSLLPSPEATLTDNELPLSPSTLLYTIPSPPSMFQQHNTSANIINNSVKDYNLKSPQAIITNSVNLHLDTKDDLDSIYSKQAESPFSPTHYNNTASPQQHTTIDTSLLQSFKEEPYLPPYYPISPPLSHQSGYSNHSSPTYPQSTSPILINTSTIKTESTIDLEESLEEFKQLQKEIEKAQSSPTSFNYYTNDNNNNTHDNKIQYMAEPNKTKDIGVKSSGASDYQILREVLRDTSFQKKFNLRPFDFGNIVSGFTTTDNIKMEEPDESNMNNCNNLNIVNENTIKEDDILMETCNEELDQETIEPVLSLAFEQMQKEVNNTSKVLGISTDPTLWNNEDVKAWLSWTTHQFNLPPVQMDYFNMDGQILASLTEEDFSQRTPQGGCILHGALEIWKAACLETEIASMKSPINNNNNNMPSPMTPIPLLTPTSPVPVTITQIQSQSPSSNNPPVNSNPTSQTGMWNKPNSNQSSTTSSGEVSDDEEDETSSAATPTTPAPPSIPATTTTLPTTKATTSRGTSGGTHIHLWQFLKELLASPTLYGSAIRWLDRSKGVFKIEDSVRVARLWGKRKNRPAMNYDKLSRSIRQYYKKGIMKKTERSQRLVYQFCHPYCL